MHSQYIFYKHVHKNTKKSPKFHCYFELRKIILKVKLLLIIPFKEEFWLRKKKLEEFLLKK